MKSLHHSPFLVRCSSFKSYVRVPPPAIQRSKWRTGFSLLLFSFSMLFAQTTLGDLNQDELINVNDILRTVNIILEIPPPPSETEQVNADLNVDEAIDISDIIIIVDIILNNLDGYCTNDEWDIPCETNYSQCCYPITSHEFEWEIWQSTAEYPEELNLMRDCHVLAPDNIWCMGEFHGVETETDHGNFIHYNGDGFELIDLGGNPDFDWYFYIHNSMVLSSTEIIWSRLYSNEYTIYNGGDNHIFANEGIIYPDLPFIWDLSFWGFNSQNLYFTYINGDIYHWDGEGFMQMDSPVASIPGTPSWINANVFTVFGPDVNHIYAISRENGYESQNSYKILFNDGVDLSWAIIYEASEVIPDSTHLYGGISAMWAFRDTLYLKSNYPGCHQMWKESIHTRDGTWSYHTEAEADDYSTSIYKGLDGNHYNDIFSVNRGCDVIHYNGEEWEWDLQPRDLIDPISSFHTSCTGISVNDDTVVIYGKHLYGEIFVLIGTRS